MHNGEKSEENGREGSQTLDGFYCSGWIPVRPLPHWHESFSCLCSGLGCFSKSKGTHLLGSREKLCCTVASVLSNCIHRISHLDSRLLNLLCIQYWHWPVCCVCTNSFPFLLKNNASKIMFCVFLFIFWTFILSFASGIWKICLYWMQLPNQEHI